MPTHSCGAAYHRSAAGAGHVPPSVRYNLALFLAKRSLYSAEDALALDGIVLQTSLFRETDYVLAMSAIAYNLSQNPSLRSVPPQVLARMGDREMRAGTPLEQIDVEQAQRKERFERRLAEKSDLASDGKEGALLQCRRCKQTDISYQQKQTRSADESMTIFCSCNSCGARWKM